MEPLFRTENLAFHTIRFADLALAEGSATFITGDSGTGKSTLLKLCNGVLSPTAGVMFFRGRDVSTLDPIRHRREVLLAGQSVYLLDATIGENFAALHRYRDCPLPDQATMVRYLHLCRADFSLDSNCAVMSGGERQRVFIAICLSFSPQVLLLDEPTSALDGENARGLLENLRGYCREKGRAMVTVSHDRSLVERFADAVITLGGGREP